MHGGVNLTQLKMRQIDACGETLARGGRENASLLTPAPSLTTLAPLRALGCLPCPRSTTERSAPHGSPPRRVWTTLNSGPTPSNGGSAGGGASPVASSCWRCSAGGCPLGIAQEEDSEKDKGAEGAGAAGGGPGEAPQAFQPRGERDLHHRGQPAHRQRPGQTDCAD